MILIVIPCHSGDCLRAEKLLDQIIALNRKEQSGHALLAFAPDVPQENRDKLRITAEVAFKSVSTFSPALPKEFPDKPTAAATFIAFTAQHVFKNFKIAWLWLEPDCLPLRSNWIRVITDAWDNTPMRYVAGHLKYGDAIGMSRVAVYAHDATRDIEASASTNIPFDFYAVNMSMKSRLFQTASITSDADIAIIRPDAVLAHGDKAGVLIEKITQQALAINELQDGEPVVVRPARAARQASKTISASTPILSVNKPPTTSASAQV